MIIKFKHMDQRFWYIHGKAYDLTDFLSRHPGGSDQPMVGKGRDCTELFESMHWKTGVRIPSNYLVDESDVSTSTFKWDKTREFYSYVNHHWSRRNDKANILFWLVSLLLWTLQIVSAYQWLVHAQWWWAPFVIGMMSASLGFMVFHTAGHNAISKNPWINRFWYNLYGNWIIGFFSEIWDVHHNYGHHSYTNIYRKDPDVNNAKSFIRKTLEQNYRRIYRYQTWLNYGILVFFPGQWMGQVFEYVASLMRRRVFGIPLKPREIVWQRFWKFMIIPLMITGYLIWTQGIFRALAGVYLHAFGFGFTYWAAVFPNHETEKSSHSNINSVTDTDWVMHQITHSCNFGVPKWISYLIGGMNYQIEHHLFPTVHPRHYPELSKYVQRFCQDSGIRYNYHSSWCDALFSNYHHLKSLGKE